MNNELTLPDQKERNSAITNLDQNVVVIAGAGTGKTTLLIDRMVYLLLGKELPVESLVTLTFTEKAASEMKMRLVEKLKSIYHSLLSPDRNTENKEIIDDIILNYRSNTTKIQNIINHVFNALDKAHIDTIHSFAAHLLRLYPLEAGVDPNFEVDEADNFNEIFAEEWDKWLEKELSIESIHKEQWLKILSQIELDQIELLVKKLSNFSVPLDSLRKKPVKIETTIKLYSEEIKALLPKAVNGKKIDRQVEILDKVFSCISKDKSIHFLDILTPEEKELLFKPVNKKIKGWTDEEKEKINNVRKFACSLSTVADEILNELIDLVISFIKKFRTRYTEEGYVSFDGLLVLARDLLRDNIRVREELKTTYNAVLVDEFQDTDPLQVELLLFLAERNKQNARNWNKIELQPGKMFIVGDPKQSIYYFRGADIAAFQIVRDMIKKQKGQEYTLTTNFRSYSGIINMVNTVFSRLIKKKENIQPEYHPIFVRPGNEPSLPVQKTELILMCNEEGGEENTLKSYQSRELEAHTIAEWINTNCSKIEIPRKDGGKKKLQFKDIAIIMRSLPSVHVYLEELRNYEIPFVVEGERSFYQVQEVIDFVNLLRAIENPEDKLALVGVLRSSLGGLTDKEIYELKYSGLLDYRVSVSGNSVAQLYRLLKSLHNQVGRLSINKLLDEILDKTYIMEIGAESYHKEQALANIMKFRRVANDIADKGITTLRELTKIMQEYIKEDVDEGENPLADETYDAVRILSIHKSKGLEYPVVFLPNLHGGKGNVISNEPVVISDWSSQMVGINIPKSRIKNLSMVILEDERKERERKEENRILYVACTRAKERLILMGNNDHQKACALNKIRRSLLPDTLQISSRCYSGLKPRSPKSRKKRGKTAKIDWQKMAERWHKRIENEQKISNTSVFRSPSALLREQEKIFVPQAAETFSPKSTLVVGTICHRILEKWNYDSSTMESLITKIIKKELRNYPCLNEKEILSEVREIFCHFVKNHECKKIRESKILGREIPFILPWEGKIMRGTIDLIYRDKENTIIVDFKTDKIKKEEKKEREKKYNIQAEIYRTAVRHILKIPNPIVNFIFLRM